MTFAFGPRSANHAQFDVGVIGFGLGDARLTSEWNCVVLHSSVLALQDRLVKDDSLSLNIVS